MEDKEFQLQIKKLVAGSFPAFEQIVKTYLCLWQPSSDQKIIKQSKDLQNYLETILNQFNQQFLPHPYVYYCLFLLYSKQHYEEAISENRKKQLYTYGHYLTSLSATQPEIYCCILRARLIMAVEYSSRNPPFKNITIEENHKIALNYINEYLAVADSNKLIQLKSIGEPADYARALLLKGRLLTYTIDTNLKEYREGLIYITRSAELGDRHACVELGFLYNIGAIYGCSSAEECLFQAIYWYQQYVDLTRQQGKKPLESGRFDKQLEYLTKLTPEQKKAELAKLLNKINERKIKEKELELEEERLRVRALEVKFKKLEETILAQSKQQQSFMDNSAGMSFKIEIGNKTEYHYHIHAQHVPPDTISQLQLSLNQSATIPSAPPLDDIQLQQLPLIQEPTPASSVWMQPQLTTFAPGRNNASPLPQYKLNQPNQKKNDSCSIL